MVYLCSRMAVYNREPVADIVAAFAKKKIHKRNEIADVIVCLRWIIYFGSMAILVPRHLANSM